jgi:hypothetical protein
MLTNDQQDSDITADVVLSQYWESQRVFLRLWCHSLSTSFAASNVHDAKIPFCKTP